MAAGALLLAGAAGVRSARRAFESPFAGFEKLVLSKPCDATQPAPDRLADEPSEDEAPLTMTDAASDLATSHPGIVYVSASSQWSVEVSVVAVSDRQVLVEHFDSLT